MSTVRGKKTLNLLKDEEFFERISEKCNYADLETVKMIYYEIIRLTSQELRHNGAIRYPDFGDFYIKYRKEKMITLVNTTKKTVIPPQKVVKFAADYKIKKYFANLS